MFTCRFWCGLISTGGEAGGQTITGWVAWRSGSVIPAMLLHGCHNAILGWIGYVQAHEATPEPGKPELIPLSWVAAGAAGVLVGATMLFFCKRRAPASIFENPN